MPSSYQQGNGSAVDISSDTQSQNEVDQEVKISIAFLVYTVLFTIYFEINQLKKGLDISEVYTLLAEVQIFWVAYSAYRGKKLNQFSVKCSCITLTVLEWSAFALAFISASFAE